MEILNQNLQVEKEDSNIYVICKIFTLKYDKMKMSRKLILTQKDDKKNSEGYL